MAEQTGGEREAATQTPASDPAAWAALSAADREHANAFLEQQKKVAVEQEVLVHLQAKELAHELSLRHWSLRVRHVSDVMKLAFEFSVAIILLAIVALIAGAVWSAANDTGAVIEAFSVPPDMAARGITGEVVASKLLDRLSFLQAQTASTRAGSSYAGNWGEDIKVQIPDTGISVGELDRFLHEWLGHQTRITGDVYRTADGIAVTARAGNETSPTLTGHEADLDSLIDKAARAVYRATQPYRYARYLTNQFLSDPTRSADYAEGITILKGLTHVGSPEDRAWAYDGLGSALVPNGDFRGEAAMMRKSIAIKPGLDADDTLAVAEGRLGHDEESLRATVNAMAMMRQGITFGLDPAATAQISLLEQETLASLRGDYATALSRGAALHDLPVQKDNSLHLDSAGYLLDALACSGMHDTDCLDRVREAGSDSLGVLALVAPDIALGRFAAATKDLGDSSAGLNKLPAPLRDYLVRRYVLKYRALIAANSGHFADARGLIANAPADCVDCMGARGRIDAMAGDPAGAAFWYERAIAAAPSIPFGFADFGELLLREGKYDAAIAKFRAANLKGPRFADPLEMWGEALMLKNRSDLALAKFEEANKYAPNWGRLHLEWGKTLFFAGKRDEAKKEFETASHLDLNAADRAALARWRAGA